MIVGDTVGPLPEGIGHIMRMTLLAPKFRNLDLTRKSILFLTPPPRGASSIGVTTTLATLTSSAPTPPVGGGLSEMEVSVDTLSSSEDWQWLGNALPTGESAARPGAGLLPVNTC